VFGSEGAANVLQLATQAATPHQREVERDFPVESFSLLLPLILAIAILETNGTAGVGDSDFFMPDPRSAGSDGHHIINFGSARRSVKWHGPYSCSVNEPFVPADLLMARSAVRELHPHVRYKSRAEIANSSLRSQLLT
jgi:hypothetical protein